MSIERIRGRFPFPLRRSFLLLLTLVVAHAASAGERRPNLLFILTDNQSAELLPSYGNRDIETPHIDALARQGMLFRNAFAVNGMCSPTRATLMTGLLPSQHGVHNWLDDEQLHTWPQDWVAVREFATLPSILAAHGYRTGLVGKWHLGQPWSPSIGYRHWVTFASGHTVDFWDNAVIDNDRQYRVSGKHIVDYFTEKAIEFIGAQSGEQPFYLQLNYDGPYVNPPTNSGPARNRHYGTYAERTFVDFPTSSLHPNLVEQLLQFNRTGRQNAFLARILEATLAMNGDQATKANIASQNALVDEGVGDVLNALRKAGLSDNTLIVFSSDQGNFFGQQGLWTHTIITQPSNLRDTAMHIPLIFAHPEGIPAGSASDLLVGQYDLPATVLDYLGLDASELDPGPGRSFAAALRGHAAFGHAAGRPVFFEQEETRGLRTGQFAYWERIRGLGEPELYDMQQDPMQRHNLADDPAHENTVARLSGLVTEFFATWAEPRYDLWKGGTAKGSVQRPEVFQRLYGDDWTTVTDPAPTSPSR